MSIADDIVRLLVSQDPRRSADSTLALLIKNLGADGAACFRVPLHPLHRAILIGFAAYLSVHTLALSFIGWLGGSLWARQVTLALEGATYVVALVWWARAAWRPLRAPNPIVSRLQPWAHSW